MPTPQKAIAEIIASESRAAFNGFISCCLREFWHERSYKSVAGHGMRAAARGFRVSVENSCIQDVSPAERKDSSCEPPAAGAPRI